MKKHDTVGRSAASAIVTAAVSMTLAACENTGGGSYLRQSDPAVSAVSVASGDGQARKANHCEIQAANRITHYRCKAW